MAFKHPNGYFYCELVIPGYGKLPRLSLGTKRKADALRMEEAIRALGREALTRPRLHAVLDALRPRGRGQSGSLSAAEVLVARHAGGFEGLCRRLDDPLLVEVLDAYQAACGHAAEDGHADLVIRRYGAALRLSDVTEGAGVTALLEAIASGEEKLRSSVRRYEKRLLSKVLTWRLGRAERNRVFSEVRFDVEPEKRLLVEEVITTAALDRLKAELDAGYFKDGDEWARVLVDIALVTGAAIPPLSRSTRDALTLVEHGGETWGRLYLSGTKQTRAGGRDRSVWLLPRHIERLRSRLAMIGPSEALFPLVYTRFTTMWQKAVRRAGLDRAVVQLATKTRKPLRPHDTRRIYAMMAERAQLDRVKVSKAGLGHASFEMTARYEDRVAQFTPEEMVRLDAAYAS